MNKEHLVELPRDKITFYGDTEKEKKLNEELFDMGLELSGLYDENKSLRNALKQIKEYIKTNSYFESNIVKTMVLQDYSDGILEIIESVEICEDCEVRE